MSLKNTRSEPKEILGLNRITKKRLLELCKKDKLYQTPSLNDVLYLHYQGFQYIECLEDYIELKCLWLECNALSEIQGLENQTKLKCLFLQSNLIKKIENLEHCKELDTINLSQNHIRRIDNINSDVLPVLNTLNLSSNYIKDCEGLRELENCKNLSVVDLSNNRIDDILVVKIFAKMPELKVLILQGNPVVSKIPQYRKTLILECKNLTYLDSRPVFPKDRACAEAWKRGGYQEERKENERWNRKDRKKIRDSVNATIRMRNKNRKPEDHLTLLVSSDSEDELAATNRRRQQQELDAGVTMELGIWDEVAGDDNKSETTSSSDMNVSSSTSVISTTDSNGDTSNASSKVEEETQRVYREELKILNVPMDGKDNDPCQLDESKNMETVLEFAEKGNLEETSEKAKGIVQNLIKTKMETLENAETIQLNESEIAKDTESKKELPDFNQDAISMRNAEEIQLNKEETDANISKTKGSHLERGCVDEFVCDKFVQEDSGNGCLEEFEKLEPIALSSEHNAISEYNTSEESEDAKETYDHTIQAIYRVTMNNLSHSEMGPKDSGKRVHLQIEINDENYEPIGEMEEAMKTMIVKEDVEREKVRELNAQLDGQDLSTFKTQSQIEFEQECLQVNEEVQKDFEKMSSNMDVAMAQFQRDQEERQEVIKALFSQKEASKEISSEDSADEAKEAYEENLRIERMVNQWDRETKLKGGKGDVKTGRIQVEVWKPVDSSSCDGTQRRVTEEYQNDQIEEIDQNLKELDTDQIVNEKDSFSEVLAKNGGNHRDEEKLIDDQNKYSPKKVSYHTSEKETTKPDSISFIEAVSREAIDEENVPNVGRQEHMEDGINMEDSTKIHSTTGCVKQFDSGQTDPQGHRLGDKLITDKINTSSKMELEKDNFTNTNDDDFYEAMDVTSLTRVSNDALASFEKEAKQLKHLLQKLEDDNEQLFSDLNAETQCEKEENSKELKEKRIKKKENTESTQEQKRENNMEAVEKSGENNENGNGEEHKRKNGNAPDDRPLEEILSEDSIGEICEQTLGDIIQSLDLTTRKPKSFEFPLELELEEDDNEPRKELPLSKTIRNVIDSFNDLFKTTTSLNSATPTDQSCGLKKAPLSSCEKTTILNELVNSTNLKQFNKDTHESLDALLREYKEERSHEVREIVDRVYAQKDRYNDTIELIDGKLMVVHKETGELTELPQSRSHRFSEDSDTDYDTAESGEEEEGACCSKPRVRNGVNVSPWKWGPAESGEEEEGACCSKPRVRNRVNVSPRKWSPAESGEEEEGACCSKPRVRNRVNVSPRKWGPAESGEEEEGACCSKPRVRNRVNVSPRKWSPAESGEEEEGACCSKPRTRTRVNVWPRKWGPYTLADYKPAEVIMQQALGSAPSKAINQQANEESDEEDEYYSLDVQNIANVYANIDREVFDAMNFDHLNLNEQDESHIAQCVRSYEELKHMFKTHKAERGLTPEENELLEKMVESRQSREKGNQQQKDIEIPREDELLRKLMERTRENTVTVMEKSKQPERLNDVEMETTPYKISKEPIKILEYNPTMNVGDNTAPGERLPEMGGVRDVRFVENECTEIYGDDVFTFIHDELLENIEEENDNLYLQDVQDLHEFLKSKKIKENLNRKEHQREENKVAEIGNVESFSEIIPFSVDEKNEMEYNVDVEDIMRKKELVSKEGISGHCDKTNPSKNYILHSQNTALTSESWQSVDVCQGITVPDFSFKDPEKISKDFKEISNLPTNQSNDARENWSQLKDNTAKLEYTTNLKKEFQNIKQFETEAICPVDVQVQSSALSINTFSVTQNLHSLECSLKMHACEKSTQQHLKTAEILHNTSHVEASCANLSNDNQIDSASPAKEVDSNEMPKSKLKAGVIDHYSNLSVLSDCTNPDLTPLPTMPVKEFHDSTELKDFCSNSKNSEPQPKNEIPYVDNKSLDILEVDILECNLEILGCNEDVIDSITVNAEIHYEN